MLKKERTPIFLSDYQTQFTSLHPLKVHIFKNKSLGVFVVVAVALFLFYLFGFFWRVGMTFLLFC